MISKYDIVEPLRFEEGVLYILDQTQLPEKTVMLKMDSIEDTWDAIKQLKVRGAPAIGVAAGYGLALGVQDIEADTFDSFFLEFMNRKEYLASSRPTAVNLFWALDRMKNRARELREESVPVIKQGLIEEAMKIHEEDIEVCRKIGEYGLQFFKDDMGVLTHCNAGGIATSRYGTALSPIYFAHEKGWNIRVYADETRPLLQGARLTAWELHESGIDVTLITDNMAAMVMSKGWVQAVIVGCDRVAANGDVANKIGTYGVALLAKAHNIPVYVACPTSTIDLQTKTGMDIPIEERDEKEVTEGFGKRTAPVGVKVFNPAFDVTPHELVTAIITEKGVVTAPYEENIKALFE
ncbi:MAG: S-methyl-5-thioribose-1-phosphate isomerase [Bacillus sp. (in: Bacteria)]|nr:S-methyl-5-thioribose-1-phosphate isomerase [Bacillus sp. (in: firmicutes)]